MQNVLLIIHVILAIAMIGVILLQRSEGGGLGMARSESSLLTTRDNLRQSALALEYYRRAIMLAEKRPASFDLATARNRASQLAN